MINEDVFRVFLKENRLRQKTLRKELKDVPQGKLYQKRHAVGSGNKVYRDYFVMNRSENGKQIQKGINTEPEMIAGLIKRELYEKELLCLESNEKAVEACLRNIQSFQLFSEIEKLRIRCPSVTEDMIFEALKAELVSKWEAEEYEQSNYRVEERTQRTRNGLKVRSKSELLIAESLYDYSLPFRYEQLVYIKDKSFAPDFTILKQDGTIAYWEHFGLTNTKDYLEHQLYKLRMYASVDIVPWNNLIITYDDSSGNVDLRIIRSEIENKLL